MPVINNVVFCFTKIQTPTLKYQSNTEKEWSVDCVVDKKTAKAWNKEFTKQKAKEVDNEDFEKIFKIAPPFADQDEQYIIKLKKNAQYKKDGELIPTPEAFRPRVFKPNAEGKIEDITKDVLVSNGSKGVASYETVENSFGKFAQLKAIRVDDLIEYNAGGTSFDELGDVASLATGFEELDNAEEVPKQEVVEQDIAKQVEDDFDEVPF